MRGKRNVLSALDDNARIIPARAGQTAPATVVVGANADHPRACGANSLNAVLLSAKSGSSPRVRGKRHEIAINQFHARIIPARAGQTVTMMTRAELDTDHPRACGANTAVQSQRGAEYGSSPRVRGKRPCVGIVRRPRRIIPARAGQTGSSLTKPMPITDHPRACGANTCCHRSWGVAGGSSPRVRGKRSAFA